MHALHCQQTGLPAPDPLDDAVLQIPAETRHPISSKITTPYSSTAHAFEKVENGDDDVTVLKSKPITMAADDRVCSDLKQTASHVTAPIVATPDVRPKTSAATPTAASTNITPAKTPIPKPRVSIARDFNEQRAVYDKHGKFVGYVSDSGGLVLTDPHATAPLTAQAAVAANTTLPTTPANPAPLPQSTPTGYVPPLDPNASVYQPSFTSSQGTDKSFKQLVDLMSLPKPNLLTFSGDPLSYHTFMNAFDTCIDSADVTDAAKLNRLLELCQGKARAVIKSCTLKEPSAGYAQARQRLRERFGDSFVISEAWVKKIVDGPPVKPNNIDSLQSFADDVRDCVDTLTSMKLLNEVDSRTRLVRLVKRLPDYLISRWRKKVMTQRRDFDTYPSISMFLEFLEEVTLEASDPVFGIAALKDDKTVDKPKQKQQQGKSASYAVETQAKVDEKPVPVAQQNVVVQCALCSKDHVMSKCPDFKKLAPLKRLETARDKKVCFNCLRRSKHSAKFCNRGDKCGTDGCEIKHSSLLHHGFIELAKIKDAEAATALTTETVSNDSTRTSVSAHSRRVIEKTHGKTALPIVSVTVSAS